MRTKVFIETFKGHELFAIYEVDDNDNKLKQTPVISFGGTKASLIVNHIDSLKQFADKRAKNVVKANIDINKLSPEEQQALESLMSKATNT
jgi:hypothetical protein